MNRNHVHNDGLSFLRVRFLLGESENGIVISDQMDSSPSNKRKI